MSNKEFPFPFFGSGDAEYFEFADVCVVFKEAPSEQALEAMLDTVPPVFTADDEPGLNGRILTLSGGQMSQVWIAEHYEPDDGEEPDYESHMPSAAPSQVEKFNRDIERWLRELPADTVDFALRAPDWEAGGTEYDDWHEWSQKSVAEVRERFGDEDEWIAERLGEFAEEAE